jgi:lysozyme
MPKSPINAPPSSSPVIPWPSSPLLLSLLSDHEGRRPYPYVDTVGKTTIGIGRNLTDIGLSSAEIDFLYRNDVERVVADLDRELPWWRELDEPRQAVLLDMCFNLGIGGLLGFRNTLDAIRRRDFQSAGKGMRASKWARQVKRRAERLARMMETGEWAKDLPAVAPTVAPSTKGVR